MPRVAPRRDEGDRDACRDEPAPPLRLRRVQVRALHPGRTAGGGVASLGNRHQRTTPDGEEGDAAGQEEGSNHVDRTVLAEDTSRWGPRCGQRRSSAGEGFRVSVPGGWEG